MLCLKKFHNNFIPTHSLNYCVWIGITNEGSVPEMSILLIKIRFKMVYTS